MYNFIVLTSVLFRLTWSFWVGVECSESGVSHVDPLSHSSTLILYPNEQSEDAGVPCNTFIEAALPSIYLGKNRDEHGQST